MLVLSPKGTDAEMKAVAARAAWWRPSRWWHRGAGGGLADTESVALSGGAVAVVLTQSEAIDAWMARDRVRGGGISRSGSTVM